MKILIVSQYFYPEQFRISDVAVELHKRGHAVTVLTGLPNYPSGEVFDGFQKSFKTVSDYRGISIIRCKIRPRHKGTINLILNYWSFARNATKRIKKIKDNYDVVFVYGVSPITQAIPAIKYKKKHHIPVFYYCLDLWPESVLGEQNGHKQISKKGLIYWFAKNLSKYIYKNVDVIGVKCGFFRDYLKTTFSIDESKISLLYEHAESDYLKVSDIPVQNGIVDFVFLGNIGKIQNCNQIIEAFSKMSDNQSALLHFVGEGSELANIKRKAEILGVSDRVVFHGHHPLSDIIRFYDLADFCVLALSNKTSTGLTIPAKLPGYMAASRPIIASLDGESKTIIKHANCGYVCPADDVEGLTELFNRAQRDRLNGVDVYKLGLNGRRFFLDNFTIDKFVVNLEMILNNLVVTKI